MSKTMSLGRARRRPQVSLIGRSSGKSVVQGLNGLRRRGAGCASWRWRRAAGTANRRGRTV